MKKSFIFISLSSLLLTFACSDHKEESAETPLVTTDTSLQYFGDSITMEGSVPADQLLSMIAGKDSISVKLSGTIEEVCQKKGCWMNMAIGNGQNMRVRFKDYGFFVPKDAAGKTVILEGYAYNDTISVAELKHYAEDAGKTKEEISKITEPELSISFESHGLILKN